MWRGVGSDCDWDVDFFAKATKEIHPYTDQIPGIGLSASSFFRTIFCYNPHKLGLNSCDSLKHVYITINFSMVQLKDYCRVSVM